MNDLVLYQFRHDIQSSLGLRLCDFGCGGIALFYSTRKKWRCSPYAQQCPVLLENHRNKITGKFLGPKSSSWGKPSPFKGKKKSAETLARMKKGRKWGKDHPMFGKHLSEEAKQKISLANKGKTVSPETRRLQSIAARNNIINGSLHKNGLFKSVKYYDIKNINGQWFKVQGTWELKLAEFLNGKNVLWSNGESINYCLDSVIKKYYPDFYLPNYNKYIEVKGWYMDKDKRKMAAVLSQNNVIIEMAFKKDIENLSDFWARISL